MRDENKFLGWRSRAGTHTGGWPRNAQGPVESGAPNPWRGQAAARRSHAQLCPAACTRGRWRWGGGRPDVRRETTRPGTVTHGRGHRRDGEAGSRRQAARSGLWQAAVRARAQSHGGWGWDAQRAGRAGKPQGWASGGQSAGRSHAERRVRGRGETAALTRRPSRVALFALYLRRNPSSGSLFPEPSCASPPNYMMVQRTRNEHGGSTRRMPGSPLG